MECFITILRVGIRTPVLWVVLAPIFLDFVSAAGAGGWRFRRFLFCMQIMQLNPRHGVFHMTAYSIFDLVFVTLTRILISINMWRTYHYDQPYL